jgi:3-phosphoglycerate kinase
MLSTLLDKPQHPFSTIIGGAKISDKVDAIFNLLNMTDTILVGGAVANVFLKAEGKTLGSSFIEDVFVDKAKREKKDWVEDAKEILKKASSLGKRVVVPTDLIVSDGVSSKVIDLTKDEIPLGFMALDIGPDTQKTFANIISESKTIFINGPMGKFEDENFSLGSQAVFNAMKKAKSEAGADIIIAGGDTIDVARKYGNLDDYSNVSLAGGATLEFLAGKELPALAFLVENSTPKT